MAYLKQLGAARAPADCGCASPSRSRARPARALRRDANELAGGCGSTCAYLDPPYNQHSYFANYHVWETIVRNDAPGHYGVACKREDVRDDEERVQLAPHGVGRAAGLIERLPTRGWWSPSRTRASTTWRTSARCWRSGLRRPVAIDSKRYVGARIGIHNPAGERVGSVSHLRNTEVVFVCGPRRAAVERAAAA